MAVAAGLGLYSSSKGSGWQSFVGQRCPGAVYLSQTLQFRKPVYLGDELTASVEVEGIGGAGRLLEFATRCCNQEGELVLEGKARVLMPRARRVALLNTEPTRSG